MLIDDIYHAISHDQIVSGSCNANAAVWRACYIRWACANQNHRARKTPRMNGWLRSQTRCAVSGPCPVAGQYANPSYGTNRKRRGNTDNVFPHNKMRGPSYNGTVAADEGSSPVTPIDGIQLCLHQQGHVGRLFEYVSNSYIWVANHM